MMGLDFVLGELWEGEVNGERCLVRPPEAGKLRRRDAEVGMSKARRGVRSVCRTGGFCICWIITLNRCCVSLRLSDSAYQALSV